MNLHFIGIGGIGISALAQFCAPRGDNISGSDVQDSSILEKLRKKNFKIFLTHDEKNIPKNTDTIIFTEAISPNNPELVWAKKNNLPVFSYFEYLGQISKKFKTIAVAGTHGKTTTTGLLASGFLQTNFAPTVIIGSELKIFGNSNFYSGKNNFLLVEACEYRNNFRFLTPEIVLLTSVTFDHPDFYKDEDHYLGTFRIFCEKAKTVIFHTNDKNAQLILKNFSGQKIMVPSEQNIDINLYGQKNKENAMLAFSCAKLLNLDEKKFLAGLKNFSGASRRQEFLGEKNGIKIFDDYGHHPVEIKTTLQAFREKFPEKKIGLIFEPHQFSRTKKFFDEFLSSFDYADEIGLHPIYEARDSEDDKLSINLKNFIQKNPKIKKIETINDAENFFKKFYKGDVLIFMGAGVISDFAKKFMKK